VHSPSPSENPGPDGPPAGAFVVTPNTYRPRWWLHITLFLATFASTTIAGCLMWSSLPAEMAHFGLVELLTDQRFYFAGLKFSVPLMIILSCHEAGHYIAARRYGLTATPPFFIPFPFLGIGTFGAVIRIKDPIQNKRQLLDVGAAGPIAGFVALIPFLAYGIMASETGESLVEGTYLEFGEPLVYRLLETVLKPGLGDEMTLWLHPTGVAAWFGVLVTLLNLLPFAQLDGGHIGYALFGRWHQRLVWPLLGVLAGLGFIWPGWWLWVAIVLYIKPQHPILWDEDRPIDRRRQLIGWAAIVIFVLCFVAEPIRIVF